MNYRLLQPAELELAKAASWYEAQAAGLGLEFLDEFEAAMERVTQFPEAWTKVSARHRRCLFRRFPFAVIFSHSGNQIRVAAIADLRRNPERAEKRMKET
jgi:plasmid stabilization system protein ParE